VWAVGNQSELREEYDASRGRPRFEGRGTRAMVEPRRWANERQNALWFADGVVGGKSKQSEIEKGGGANLLGKG
jgi:hypothetical protein